MYKVDQPKPYAKLARLTALELDRLADLAEQGKREQRAHVEFMVLMLRANANVLEAELLRTEATTKRAGATTRPVRKCLPLPRELTESGEHPAVVDMDPTPSQREWSVA